MAAERGSACSLAIAIFALPFVLYWGRRVEAAMFAPSAYAVVALVVVTVVPGFITRGRRKRLGVVRKVVGLGCDPAFRYQWRRAETVGVLMGQVGALGLPSSLETLVDRVSSMDQVQLELVFATAWYQSVSDSKWMALRESTRARLA